VCGHVGYGWKGCWYSWQLSPAKRMMLRTGMHAATVATTAPTSALYSSLLLLLTSTTTTTSYLHHSITSTNDCTTSTRTCFGVTNLHGCLGRYAQIHMWVASYVLLFGWQDVGGRMHVAQLAPCSISSQASARCLHLPPILQQLLPPLLTTFYDFKWVLIFGAEHSKSEQ
jgi:hypothetical protein